MRKLLVTASLLTVLFAGCVADDTPADDAMDTPPTALPTNDVQALIDHAQELGLVPITLAESVVDAAVDRTGDLYEPTMEVCDDRSIYITAHTIGVDSTGAPVFGSHDNGTTWSQLPFTRDLTMPGDLQGATPPVTDEIFLACGDDGWLYGSDITLATYPVNAWSGHGSQHSYWNFNAYDETRNVVQAGECDTLGAVPVAAPAKDRPWVAYSNGTLLLTSNPAGGANQIGVVSVPFQNVAPYSLGSVVDGVEWNVCAGPGGSIPGIPDIRADGLFAAPQRSGDGLWLTVGHKDDVMAVENIEVFKTSTGGEITSVYGHAAFDAEGTLFVGVSNNTAADDAGNRTGQMQFAVSLDGETFTDATFVTGDRPLRHFYMDANDFGPGALVVWAVDGDEGYDWYMAHLQAIDGAPVLTDAFQVIDEGPRPSAHVTGAAVGPDGRAYTAMYTGGGSPDAPTTPLSVYVQTDGPTLPVA